MVRRGANTLRRCGVLCVNFAKNHQRFSLARLGCHVGRRISETSKGATILRTLFAVSWHFPESILEAYHSVSKGLLPYQVLSAVYFCRRNTTAKSNIWSSGEQNREQCNWFLSPSNPGVKYVVITWYRTFSEFPCKMQPVWKIKLALFHKLLKINSYKCFFKLKLYRLLKFRPSA